MPSVAYYDAISITAQVPTVGKQRHQIQVHCLVQSDCIHHGCVFLVAYFMRGNMMMLVQTWRLRSLLNVKVECFMFCVRSSWLTSFHVKGADLLNYCEVVEFIRDTTIDPKKKSSNTNSHKVIGVVVRDTMTDQQFKVYARSVLLCGGPFTDSVRKLAHVEPESETADANNRKRKSTYEPAVLGASGVHIVLPGYFAPSGSGAFFEATLFKCKYVCCQGLGWLI